jgi:cephalosporin hydroxylase
MWRNYFPHATIYGIDLYEKWLDDEARITSLKADQSDPSALRQAVDQCPPFDLVVDDGSHVGSHILTAFDVLFPKVTPGGYYAIEDLETSYLPAYGGGLPGAPGTAAALSKELLDDLNIGSRPIAAVHAYPGLVLVEKAADAEAATPQLAARQDLCR